MSDNIANLNRLIEIIGEKNEDFYSLIDDFIEYYPKQLELFDKSIAEKNYAKLAKLCHKLKGSMVSFDAKILVEILQKMENEAKKEEGWNIIEIENLFCLLKEKMKILSEYLKNIK